MGKLVLAHPYAKAAFLYASEHQELSAWGNFLSAWSAFISEGQIQSYLRSRSFSAAGLEDLFKAIFVKLHISAAQENYLKVLEAAHRLALLPEIAEGFQEFCREAAHKIEAKVTSARTLTTSQKTELTRILQIKFSREVELHCEEDASCLAGLRVSVGDWIFDNTLQRRFDRLKNTLLGESHV